MKAQSLGNDNYKFVVPSAAGSIDNTWQIIWNDGSGNQTADLKYQDRYLYSGANKGSISPTSQVSAICAPSTDIDLVSHAAENASKIMLNGALYLALPDGSMYDARGARVK